MRRQVFGRRAPGVCRAGSKAVDPWEILQELASAIHRCGENQDGFVGQHLGSMKIKWRMMLFGDRIVIQGLGLLKGTNLAMLAYQNQRVGRPHKPTLGASIAFMVPKLS